MSTALFGHLGLAMSFFVRGQASVLTRHNTRIPSSFNKVLPLRGLKRIGGGKISLSLGCRREVRRISFSLKNGFAFTQGRVMRVTRTTKASGCVHGANEPVGNCCKCGASNVFGSRRRVSTCPGRRITNAKCIAGPKSVGCISISNGNIMSSGSVACLKGKGVPRVVCNVGNSLG